MLQIDIRKMLSWFRGGDSDEPVMHITPKGGWYTDADKLLRSPKTKKLVEEMEPIVREIKRRQTNQPEVGDSNYSIGSVYIRIRTLIQFRIESPQPS